MKRHMMVLLLILFLLPVSANAEIKTVTHTIKQPFGGSQSPDDARTAAIAKAKREALEQFGTYIESTTVVKNSQLDSEEILALSAGVTKAEVIKQKNYTDGDAFGIEITVKVVLDTAVLEKNLKKLLEDRNHLKELKAALIRQNELLVKLVELEKQNKQQSKTEQQENVLRMGFQSTSQRLIAIELFTKAFYIWMDNEPATLKLVIDYLTQAINLAPDFTPAYINRATAFIYAKRIDSALEDLNKAIQLDSSIALAYHNRGNIYKTLDQVSLARSDYNKAILLDSNNAEYYISRSALYAEMYEYSEALGDLKRAIYLDPKNAKAYYNSGLIHANLNQLNLAIADFNQAINLDKKLMKAYVNRGTAYAKLQKNELAILDFDKAINLDPNNAIVYSNRGIAQLMLNKSRKGCADIKKACKLGVCNVYESVKKDKLCK